MARVRRVTPVAAIIIHDVILDKYLPDETTSGVMRGVRDSSLLISAIESPFQTWGGKDLHSDVLDQAAALLRSIIKLALEIARGHGDATSISRIKRHLRKYVKQAKPQARGILERFIPADLAEWLARDVATKLINAR